MWQYLTNVSTVIKNTRLTLEMIKIEHTLFALPFAFLGAVLAARGLPSAWQILWIVLAMVGARSAAMAFNRIADRNFDARNPRTASRAIPAGLDADLLQVHVVEGSRLAGVEIVELSLPVGSAVTLVVRGGSALVPRPSTVIQVGDDLLLVTTESVRSEVERRLRAVSRGGRLADWKTPRRRPRR